MDVILSFTCFIDFSEGSMKFISSEVNSYLDFYLLAISFFVDYFTIYLFLYFTA